MTATPQKRHALEVSGAALMAVVVATFLPWGEVDLSRISMSLPGELDEGFNQMFAALGTVPVTVWNGHASIGELKLPNVLVLFAAVTAAVISWLRAISVWNVRAAVPITLAGYGLAHAGYVLVYLLVSAEGSAGIGLFLTTSAFAWMLVALCRREMKVTPV